MATRATTISTRFALCPMPSLIFAIVPFTAVCLSARSCSYGDVLGSRQLCAASSSCVGLIGRSRARSFVRWAVGQFCRDFAASGRDGRVRPQSSREAARGDLKRWCGCRICESVLQMKADEGRPLLQPTALQGSEDDEDLYRRRKATSSLCLSAECQLRALSPEPAASSTLATTSHKTRWSRERC